MAVLPVIFLLPSAASQTQWAKRKRMNPMPDTRTNIRAEEKI